MQLPVKPQFKINHRPNINTIRMNRGLEAEVELHNAEQATSRLKKRMAYEAWKYRESLEKTRDQIIQHKQLLQKLERRQDTLIRNHRDHGPKLDYRRDEDLIPIRVDWISDRCRELVYAAGFPIGAVMAEWHNKTSEGKKIEIGNKVMKLMNKEWKDVIYSQNGWELNDETKHYTENNLSAAMHKVELTYNELVPWMTDNYDIQYSDDDNCCEGCSH